jgi:thioredoxin-dependent peroxiredoxin
MTDISQSEKGLGVTTKSGASESTQSSKGDVGIRSQRTQAARERSAVGTRIDVGDSLPDITLLDQRGRPLPTASLRGAIAVVYFYPRDDTPGCTREACAFRDGLSRFKRLAAKVVGISPDSVDRHARFAEKYALPFPLLSDESREYARRCGVLVPKTLYGKTSIGIERSTFLLDREGVIRRVWRKVKVDGHAEQVESAIRELKAAT